MESNLANAPDRYGQVPLMRAERLLHIEASGAEVAIHYDLVEHVGCYADVTRFKEGEQVLDSVGSWNGTIIPVIDIRGISTDAPTISNDVAYPNFLVLSLHDQLIGVRVNRVIEVLTTRALKIEYSAGMWSCRDADFIIGMLTMPHRRIPLVDMNKLLFPPIGFAGVTQNEGLPA